MKQTNRTYSVTMMFNTTLTDKELEHEILSFMYQKSLFGKFNILFNDVVITTDG